MSTSIPSAVTYQSGNIAWNFSATTAFPLEITRNGKTRTVHVYLSPYEPQELKDILRKAVAGYKREKHDVEIVREDPSIYVPLCDAHFIQFGNSTGTPDDHAAYLAKHPELKPSIVECTFGGLRLCTPEDQTDDNDLFDISSDDSGQIAVYQDIYDEQSDKVVRVEMHHNYAQPTEAQYREYRGARRSKFIKRTTMWTVAEQHNTLERLYDTVIRSISGGAFSQKDGKTGLCDEGNKDEWIDAVPLWHKLWIVDQIFGELVEKNG